ILDRLAEQMHRLAVPLPSNALGVGGSLSDCLGHRAGNECITRVNKSVRFSNPQELPAAKSFIRSQKQPRVCDGDMLLHQRAKSFFQPRFLAPLLTRSRA